MKFLHFSNDETARIVRYSCQMAPLEWAEFFTVGGRAAYKRVQVTREVGRGVANQLAFKFSSISLG